MTASMTSAAAGEPSPEDEHASTRADSSPFGADQQPDFEAGSPGEEDHSEAPDSAGSTAVTGEPRRKRRRRGGVRRRRRSTGDKDTGPAEEGSPEPGEGRSERPSADGESDSRGAGAPRRPAEEDGEGVQRKRRRRRRRRSSAETEGEGSAAPRESDSSEAGDEAPAAEGDEGKATKRPRRRRRGGAKRSGAAKRGRTAGADIDGPVSVEFIPGESDEIGSEESEELPDLPDEAERIDGGRRSRRGKSSKRLRSRSGVSATAADAEQDAPAPRSAKKNVILVNAVDREETRVAVVEDGRITEFQMTVKRHKSLVNDIYRGRVVNLEPAIGAAFIDFGQGRNGFLHTSDVLSAYGESDWKLEKLLTTKIDPEEWDSESSQPDVAAELVEAEPKLEAEPGEEGDDAEDADDTEQVEEVEQPSSKPPMGGGRRQRGQSRQRARPRLPISDLLKKGDQVVVQVTKDAIGDKGPTLTTYISIPGRHLVLMPSMARTGVSRKIEDEKERRRLKRILEGLDVPSGMGVIVRTAGIGCTKAELKRDLDYLMLLWEGFGQRLTLGRGPAPLYEESDVAIRTIRDMFTDGTEAVIVDDESVFKRSKEFVERLMPENLDRITLHDGARPLFHTHAVEQDFERIFSRRLDLPCGGSIVLDQTEALVAIDVNSGKTRSDGFDFEEIALKTNLDAVPEIARQIRLRDLGGIIVIDFIDMLKAAHRRQVERALSEALSSDRARSKVGRISQFGLIELTRQRLGPGLSKMLFQNCPRCRGSGRLRTVESRCEAILRRLGAALTLKGFSKVEVRAAGEVIDHLKAHFGGTLKDMEERSQRELVMIPAPDQLEDNVLRYLRADGREVRPGGRRKR